MPDIPPSATKPEYDRDVFVSYAAEDRPWVKDVLLPRLEKSGVSFIIDERDFEVGVPRLINVERALDRCRHTLVVITPAWLEDNWGGFEQLLTQTADPANRKLRLLPLMLEPCLLPPSISMLEYADFTSTDADDEDAWTKVIRALLKQANIFIAYTADLTADHMLAVYLRTAFAQQGYPQAQHATAFRAYLPKRAATG